MRYGNSWIAKAAAVAVIALVGIAVMNAPGARVGPAEAGGPAICSGPGLDQPFTEAAMSPDRQGEFAAPEALCKLRPECWRDSDCDLRCGTGLGKCVHSNCPIRICVCR